MIMPVKLDVFLIKAAIQRLQRILWLIWHILWENGRMYIIYNTNISKIYVLVKEIGHKLTTYMINLMCKCELEN